MINKNRGKFTFNSAVGWLSPGFEINDLGFGSYSDLINMHLLLRYSATKPTKYYQNAGLNSATYANFDFGGKPNESRLFLWKLYNFQGPVLVLIFHISIILNQ